MSKAYVKFSTPSDVQAKALEAIELAKNGGLRKGVNEATKAIERSEAKLVIIAEDVDPEEIVMHLPLLCGEKKVPFCYVVTKAELGKAAGLSVPTSAIAIVKAGAGEAAIKEIVSKLAGSMPASAPSAPAASGEAKAEAKPKPAKKAAAPKKE